MTGKHSATVTDPAVAAVARALETVAAERDKTVAQVAINWCICKGTVPIPGARTPEQATENCGALGWRLSDAEIAALDAVALDGNGFYGDPDALLCFLGLSPPRLLRPAVTSLLRWVLKVAKLLLPIQRDR